MSHESRVRALLGFCCFVLVLIAWELTMIGEQLDTLTEVVK